MSLSLELTGITKVHDRFKVLDELDLEVERGTFLALLAPTGSGKSTLLRVAAGLDAPDAGEVIVDGTNVTGVHVRRRNVAMVYQQFINFPTLTVYENIASPLRAHRRSYAKDDVDRRVRRAADQLQISTLLARFPSELSGGQQQRVAIARALVKDAELILFDEPLGNLDYKLREDLRRELKDLAAERTDAIFIYATPEPIDALMMASQVAILDGGKICQHGPIEQTYMQPNHVSSGRYFSSPPMNFLDCHVSDGTATVSDFLHVPLAAMKAELSPGRYTLGIRPHHIHVAPWHEPPRGAEQAPSTLWAALDLAEVVGSETTMYLSRGDMQLTALVHDIGLHELGSRLELQLDPRFIHVFDPTSGDLVLSAAATRD